MRHTEIKKSTKSYTCGRREHARLTFAAAAVMALLFAALTPAFSQEEQSGSGTQSGEQFGEQSVLDWGGFIDNSSEVVNTPGVEFSEEAKVGLWFDAQYTDSFGLYGRASYTYKDSRAFFADLDNFYAHGRLLIGEEADSPKLFRYSVGRFRFKEFTGYVLDHNLDGLRLAFEHPAFSLEAGAGYTGLSFVPSSNILVTGSDLAVQADAPESGYGLASPKVIET